MSARLKAALALCAVALVGGGCAASNEYDGTGRNPPRFKFENGTRLVKEVGWFYADIQDTIFGVDYNQDMENEFGYNPYR